MWSDLHLDEAQPYALFRESTTKDKDKRAVPLRPEIVGDLKAHNLSELSLTVLLTLRLADVFGVNNSMRPPLTTTRAAHPLSCVSQNERVIWAASER